jgi:hypothetical protein
MGTNMRPRAFKTTLTLYTLTALTALVGATAWGCATPLKGEPLKPFDGDGVPLTSVASGYSLRLEDAGGNGLPTHFHRGGTFIEGRMGEAYAVRVDNPTGRRVEVVVTVDGRDVVSGDPGDFRRQRGYIVEPYGHVRIDGFRRSLSDVAQFRFTTPGDSYSARRGTPENVGVIGVAVFSELAPPPPPPIAVPYGGYEEREKATGDGAGAPRAEAAPSPSNLGTRYGETRYAPVSEVPFQRANATEPDALLAVYYDDRAGLVRRGIVPADVYGMPGPQPFPESRKFAPPPPY